MLVAPPVVLFCVIPVFHDIHFLLVPSLLIVVYLGSDGCEITFFNEKKINVHIPCMGLRLLSLTKGLTYKIRDRYSGHCRNVVEYFIHT